MKCVVGEACGSFETKGSKFLAYLMPFAEFKVRLKALKEAHPKAVHYVSASRHFNEYEQIVESFDDDKEPRGSSGMPCLNVLRGEELIDSAVVVVRYFGGTLLGVGGLVRAYGSAVQAALHGAREQGLLESYVRLESCELALPYALLSQCEHIAKIHNVSATKLAFDAQGAILRLQGTQENLARLQAKLKESFNL